MGGRLGGGLERNLGQSLARHPLPLPVSDAVCVLFSGDPGAGLWRVGAELAARRWAPRASHLLRDPLPLGSPGFLRGQRGWPWN